MDHFMVVTKISQTFHHLQPVKPSKINNNH